VTVAVALASEQQRWFADVGNRRDQVQAQSLALAGVQWARQILNDDARVVLDGRDGGALLELHLVLVLERSGRSLRPHAVQAQQRFITENKIIAMTGSSDPRDRAQSLAAGFDHHLVKPVDPAVLKELVDSFRTSNDRPDQS
jgi:CheY-like chemotaxis protein